MASIIPTSNVAKEKQEFERRAVRLLRQAGGLDHGAELMLGSDPPDVIAKIGVLKIGIEVRRLFNNEKRSGSLSRQRLSTCQAVVESAARIHSQVSDCFIHVGVHFRRSVVIPSSRRDAICHCQDACGSGVSASAPRGRYISPCSTAAH